MSESINIIIWGLLVVFLVLYLVTLVGRLLIFVTNLLDDPHANNSIPGSTPRTKVNTNNSEISAKDLAIATATVDFITAGQGIITDIKKVKKPE